MAVTRTDTRENTVSVRFEGRVLDTRSYTRHVHSDNAMIDSGFAMRSPSGTGTGPDEDYGLGRDMGGVSYDFQIDATPEVVAQAARSKALFGWLESVRQAAKDREKAVEADKSISKGRKVEVFKGRKVPKRTYFVVRTGESSYGPYIDLSTEPNGFGKFTSSSTRTTAG